jgi:hypothetical protein
VELELVAYGFVERREEQLVDWRVEDLVWEVVIRVESVDSVQHCQSGIGMSRNGRLTRLSYRRQRHALPERLGGLSQI